MRPGADFLAIKLYYWNLFDEIIIIRIKIFRVLFVMLYTTTLHLNVVRMTAFKILAPFGGHNG